MCLRTDIPRDVTLLFSMRLVFRELVDECSSHAWLRLMLDLTSVTVVSIFAV